MINHFFMIMAILMANEIARFFIGGWFAAGLVHAARAVLVGVLSFPMWPVLTACFYPAGALAPGMSFLVAILSSTVNLNFGSSIWGLVATGLIVWGILCAVWAFDACSVHGALNRMRSTGACSYKVGQNHTVPAVARSCQPLVLSPPICQTPSAKPSLKPSPKPSPKSPARPSLITTPPARPLPCPLPSPPSSTRPRRINFSSFELPGFSPSHSCPTPTRLRFRPTRSILKPRSFKVSQYVVDPLPRGIRTEAQRDLRIEIRLAIADKHQHRARLNAHNAGSVELLQSARVDSARRIQELNAKIMSMERMVRGRVR